VFGLINAVVALPGTFALSNVVDARAKDAPCIASPDSRLFLDAIHPPTAGHASVARAALTAIPAPPTRLLAGVV